MSDKEQTLEDISRSGWVPGPNSTLNLAEKVTLGSLQRIAKATELMARNYEQMQRDLDYFKTRSARLEGENKLLKKRLSAQKGATTRAKRGN